MSEPAVAAALRSYQTWFRSDLDRLCLRDADQGGYRRPAIADGECGPNTAEILEYPRCGVPDYFARDKEEGNWPESCRHQITTSYNMSLPGLNDNELARLWQEADSHWSDVIDVDFVFQPENWPNTRIHSTKANLPGSVLADQFLAISDCSYRSQGRFDNRQWTDVLFETVTTHEHGHALGAPHSQDPLATMYPSITPTSMGRRGVPNDSDIRIMLGLGYRRRDSPPPPKPDDWVAGIMSVETPAGRKLGEIQVLPRTAEIEHTDGKVIVRDTFTIVVGGNKHKFICAPDSKGPSDL